VSQHREKKEEIAKLEEQIKDYKTESDRKLGEIQAKMTERTVMLAVKAAMESHQGEESYRDDITKHVTEDARFVDVHFEPEQRTCMLESFDAYVTAKLKEEKAKWVKYVAKPQSDEETSDEKAKARQGPKRVAVGTVRRKVREEAEGISRMTDDSTERVQAGTRPREQDGEEEGEKEKEEAKARKENEVGKRKEEERKEAEEVQRKLKAEKEAEETK
jgi:hypothetical protein